MNKEQRDAVQRAMDDLPDALRAHPGVKRLAALLSAAAPQEPQGEWVMVPGEPDDDMVDAACKAGNLFRVDFTRAWEAALAAAPAAQPTTPDAGYVPLPAEDGWVQIGDMHYREEGVRAVEREVLSRVQAVRKPLKTEEVHLTAPGPMEASTTPLPVFASGVARRKWESLQADGYRMQRIEFARSINGHEKCGSIDPWGKVLWKHATPSSGAVEAASEQHGKNHPESESGGSIGAIGRDASKENGNGM